LTGGTLTLSGTNTFTLSGANTLTLNGTITTVNANTGTADTPADNVTRRKAERIVIPVFEFKEATLDEALEFLRKKAVESDPEKTGVKIVLKPGTTSDARLTISLRDVPVIEALRYITGLANLEYLATADALVVQPMGGGGAAAAPTPQAAAASAPGDSGSESTALKKAEKIIIPKIELREATVAEIVNFLRAKAAGIDPDGKGVNILVKGEIPNSARITLSLTNIPLIEALSYTADLAGLRLKIEPNVLVLESPNSGSATGPEKKLAGTETSGAKNLPASGSVAITLSAKKSFNGNDGIEIREVSGSSPTFKVGGTYRVRGVCRQETIAKGLLYVGITAEGNEDAIQALPGASLHKEAPKGFTEFEFGFTPLRPGKLHITLYDLDNHDPQDTAYAGLYLGDVAP
jgi:hypothetical protein